MIDDILEILGILGVFTIFVFAGIVGFFGGFLVIAASAHLIFAILLAFPA